MTAGTNGDCYVGGSFTCLASVAANRIAKWDGSSWSPLGAGLNNSVRALAWRGTNLYAGGTFTNAGGIAATGIARWDGTSWLPVGSGMGGASSYVYALAVIGTDLYVGGSFTQAGGVPASAIAKWDGSHWSALSAGIGATKLYAPIVFALAAPARPMPCSGPRTQGLRRVSRLRSPPIHPRPTAYSATPIPARLARRASTACAASNEFATHELLTDLQLARQNP